MTITFKQLMEGYQRACLGPAGCDLIAAGDSIFEEIVEKISTASAKKSPNGDYIESDPAMEELKRLALEGKQPVFFMGATVIRGSMATNEVHFLNSKRPDRNQVVTI